MAEINSLDDMFTLAYRLERQQEQSGRRMLEWTVSQSTAQWIKEYIMNEQPAAIGPEFGVMDSITSPYPDNIGVCTHLIIKQPCTSDAVFRITCVRDHIALITVAGRTYSRQEIACMESGKQLGTRGDIISPVNIPLPTRRTAEELDIPAAPETAAPQRAPYVWFDENPTQVGHPDNPVTGTLVGGTEAMAQQANDTGTAWQATRRATFVRDEAYQEAFNQVIDNNPQRPIQAVQPPDMLLGREQAEQLQRAHAQYMQDYVNNARAVGNFTVPAEVQQAQARLSEAISRELEAQRARQADRPAPATGQWPPRWNGELHPDGLIRQDGTFSPLPDATPETEQTRGYSDLDNPLAHQEPGQA